MLQEVQVGHQGRGACTAQGAASAGRCANACSSAHPGAAWLLISLQAAGRSSATYGLGLRDTTPGVAYIMFLKPGSDGSRTHMEYFTLLAHGTYHRQQVPAVLATVHHIIPHKRRLQLSQSHGVQEHASIDQMLQSWKVDPLYQHRHAAEEEDLGYTAPPLPRLPPAGGLLLCRPQARWSVVHSSTAVQAHTLGTLPSQPMEAHTRACQHMSPRQLSAPGCVSLSL